MKWLCVAHEKEIPGLASLARPGWQAHALGVGQFHSLVSLVELLSSEKPEAIVLAGTCGSLEKADIMQIYLCNHFAFPAVSHEELPDFLEQNFTTTPALAATFAAQATALQNYGISLDAEKFAANTGKIPIDFPRPIVENMEAASLALTCNRRSIPFSAVLCVTNKIGPEGRSEWKQNFRSAGQKLATLPWFL